MKSKNTNGSRQGTQSQKRIVSTKKAKSRKVPQGPAQCTRCGKNSHSKAEKCPASTATCHKCNRKGHFASQCFSKTVKATADALSRAPTSSVKPTEDDSLQEDAELFVNAIASSLPASKGRLEEYAKAQLEDPTLTTVREYCSKGWPAKD